MIFSGNYNISLPHFSVLEIGPVNVAGIGPENDQVIGPVDGQGIEPESGWPSWTALLSGNRVNHGFHVLFVEVVSFDHFMVCFPLPKINDASYFELCICAQ